jgi:hypothetical protein
MSFSVVDFLIHEYGRQQMTDLLLQLQGGATQDDALQAVYGLNVDGLEAAWRASIGAAARAGASEPTPVPTPTAVPTIVPISGVPASPATPIARPTQAAPAPTQPAPTASQAPAAAGPSWVEDLGIGRVLAYAGLALLCVLIGLVIVLGPVLVTVRRRHNRRQS